jgi:hypothetical protein
VTSWIAIAISWVYYICISHLTRWFYGGCQGRQPADVKRRVSSAPRNACRRVFGNSKFSWNPDFWCEDTVLRSCQMVNKNRWNISKTTVISPNGGNGLTFLVLRIWSSLVEFPFLSWNPDVRCVNLPKGFIFDFPTSSYIHSVTGSVARKTEVIDELSGLGACCSSYYLSLLQ